jgi:hypothetical protein
VAADATGAPSLGPDVALCEASPVEGEVAEDVVVVAAVEEGSRTLALPFEGAGVDSFAADSVVPSACGGVLSGGGA